MNRSECEAAIRGKLDVYRRAWLKSDIDLFKSLWDPTYPRLTYMPMERARILRDWESIVRYWETILPITRMERWDVGEMVVDLLAADTAWVFCEHAFAYRVTDGTQEGLQPYEARTTHVFRRIPDGDWRVIHYEDSIQWFASSDEARRQAPN
jgi:ketosteroid isomerase-like protein